MKNVTGSLQTKCGKYYAVLNLYDHTGKRRQKWISTGYEVRGNKKAAKAFLDELLVTYNKKQQAALKVISKMKDPDHFIKSEKYRGAYYNQSELTELFHATKDSEIYIPVLLAAYYGLRRSEVIGIKWSNINFENGTIRIAHKVVEQLVDGKYQAVGHDKMKTESSNRILPLMKEVAMALRRLKLHQEEQPACAEIPMSVNTTTTSAWTR